MVIDKGILPTMGYWWVLPSGKTYKKHQKLLKMAIEIVDVAIKNADFP